MQPPTHDEINVYGSLDEDWAVKNFLGKTMEQAEVLFGDDRPCYFNDLFHMGPKAFCYYVRAAINYIRSSAATGDSSAIDYFHGAVTCQLNIAKNDLSECLADLRTAVKYILDNWERFDIPSRIYPDLREKYIDLLRQLANGREGSGRVGGAHGGPGASRPTAPLSPLRQLVDSLTADQLMSLAAALTKLAAGREADWTEDERSIMEQVEAAARAGDRS